jgi:hypothetical protein
MQAKRMRGELARYALIWFLKSDAPMTYSGVAEAPDGKADVIEIKPEGAAPMKQELIAGRINIGGDQLSSSLADIQAGKLKALATSASRRVAELPDVPTAAGDLQCTSKQEGRRRAWRPPFRTRT